MPPADWDLRTILQKELSPAGLCHPGHVHQIAVVAAAELIRGQQPLHFRQAAAEGLLALPHVDHNPVVLALQIADILNGEHRGLVAGTQRQGAGPVVQAQVRSQGILQLLPLDGLEQVLDGPDRIAVL